MKTRIASILLIICLSVAYAAEAPKSAETPKAPAPTIESVTKELTEAKATIAQLQAAVQALRQQRDQATQALQDTQAQAAIDKSVKEAKP